MKTDVLKLLILEDNALDAELLVDALEQAGYHVDYELVVGQDDFYKALLSGSFEVILSDFSLPQFNGLKALALAQRYAKDVPFILVSSAIGEETAVELLKSGATDFVLKTRLNRLGLVVKRALRERNAMREQQRIEVELRKAHDRFEKAADLVGSVIYEWDVVTDHVSRSASMERITGYQSDEIPSNSSWWIDQIHPEDRETYTLLFKQLAPVTERCFIEYRFRCKNGKYIHVQDRMRLTWNDQRLMVCLGSAEDVSLRKTEQQQLATDRALPTYQLSWLSHLNHSVHSYVSLLNGFCEFGLLAEQGGSSKQTGLEIVQSSGTSLSRFADDVLTLFKIDFKEAVPELKTVDFFCWMQNILDIARPGTKRKNLEFEVLLKSIVPSRIIFDEERLRSVVLGLLRDATKRSMQGKVRVEISSGPTPHPNRCEILLRVIDSGHALNRSQVLRFFQSPPTGSDAAQDLQDLGADLAVVRRMAAFTGARVDLRHSKQGFGSVFDVSFEAELGADAKLVSSYDFFAAPPAENFPEVPPTLDGMRILVVDDSLEHCLLLQSVLTRMRAQVDVVSDADAVVISALAKPYTVILMSADPHGLDGSQTLAVLRNCNYQGPVLAMTTDAVQSRWTRYFAKGFNGVIQKPIGMQALYAELQKFQLPNSQESSVGANAENLYPGERAFWRELKATMESNPAMRSLYDSYLKRLPAMLLNIEAEFNRQNIAEVERLAHAIAGTSGNFGLRDISTWAKELELTCRRTNDQGTIAGRVHQITSLLADIPRDLQ